MYIYHRLTYMRAVELSYSINWGLPVSCSSRGAGHDKERDSSNTVPNSIPEHDCYSTRENDETKNLILSVEKMLREPWRDMAKVGSINRLGEDIVRGH